MIICMLMNTNVLENNSCGLVTKCLWISNGVCQTSTSLQQSLRSQSEGYQTSSSILQASSNVYQTHTDINKYLLDSCCHCQGHTGVAKHVLAFESLCAARTVVREHLQTIEQGASSCKAKQDCGVNPSLLSSNKFRPHLSTYHYWVFLELCTDLVALCNQ